MPTPTGLGILGGIVLTFQLEDDFREGKTKGQTSLDRICANSKTKTPSITAPEHLNEFRLLNITGF